MIKCLFSNTESLLQASFLVYMSQQDGLTYYFFPLFAFVHIFSCIAFNLPTQKILHQIKHKHTNLAILGSCFFKKSFYFSIGVDIHYYFLLISGVQRSG